MRLVYVYDMRLPDDPWIKYRFRAPALLDGPGLPAWPAPGLRTELAVTLSGLRGYGASRTLDWSCSRKT